MLERNDLAHAMNELSDELLMEAEFADHSPRHYGVRRFAVAVVAAVMLAVTVCAAATGIIWNIAPEQETIEGHAKSYYKDYDGVLDFEKLEYDIPLEVVMLPEQKLRDLEHALYRHWNLMQQEEFRRFYEWTEENPFSYESFVVDTYMESYLTVFGTNLKYQPSFTSLEEIETLLGMELTVSQQIRDAINTECQQGNQFALTVKIETGETMGEVARAKGVVKATRVVINYQLDRFCGNGRINGVIHIPLTEENARKGVQGLYYSYEKEGAIWQEERQMDGRNVTLFGNNPEQGYEGWCKAIYTEDGAAYIVSARTNSNGPGQCFPRPIYDSGLDMVLAVIGE